MLKRFLSKTLSLLTAAPPGSIRGRIAELLRSVARQHFVDSVSLSEFGDLSEHEWMLADSGRVDAYAAGIEAGIGPDDVVVDLGAGSGILTFLAARRAKRVYSVEHSEMIEVARHLGSVNGLGNIEYVHLHSRDFSPPGGVDVILHEQIGDELFEENMIESVVDLRTRILRPGGRIIPSRFELYLEPVQVLDASRIPYIWELDLHGIDFSSLRESPLTAGFKRSWDNRPLNRREIDRLLCTPEPVLELDLMVVDGDHQIPCVSAERVVDEAGTADGLVLYFKALFDGGAVIDAGPAVLDSSWSVRLFKVPSTVVEPGDVLSYQLDLVDNLRPDTWRISRFEHRARREDR